jgi:glycosyltransferase involved in cell wall biosynthesis
MKVNIFHEWLDTSGGAESVLSELIGIFPNATVYTLWADAGFADDLGVEVRVSFLQHFPRRFRRLLGLPFMPVAWKLLGRNIKDGQLSITSSWVFCHSAIPRRFEKSSIHYIHTPARYWWNPEVDKRSQLRIPLAILAVLRNTDKWLARHHRNVLANSNATHDRIKKHWNLDSVVIHPPVDVVFFDFENSKSKSSTEEFLLCVGRFVPYKGHEIAIQLGELLNLPVVLVGHGEGEGRLRRQAINSTTEVSFVVNASREEIRDLYANCICLVYPAIEDFGIVPVEAMATGAVVLGVNEGGLVDSVVQGETGFLVSGLELQALLEGFRHLPKNSRSSIRAASLRFSQENFAHKVRMYLEKMMNS